MPGEDIQSWSTTAATNANADSAINWAEGMARAAVNDSSRSEMAAIAKWRNLTNGSITTTGSANAQIFTSGVGYTSTIPTGLHVLLKIGAGLTNTAGVTLNMDGIGAIGVINQAGVNLAGGELTAGNYAEFLYSGTQWVLLRGTSGVNRVVSQVFTTVGAGTYTPTAGMTHCIIECVGGGGGGGGVTGDANFSLWGGGGGAGSYARKIASAATIGAAQPIGVGAGGTGALGTGNTGGSSAVGVICTANGGVGGGGTTNAVFGAGGNGGAAGTGTFAFPGQNGLHGFYLFNPTALNLNIIAGQGQGGSSYIGQGGACAVAGFGGAANGGAAGLYGSGGGGGANNKIGGGSFGGNGSQGIIIITEFVAL